jgi:hypothetical protein
MTTSSVLDAAGPAPLAGHYARLSRWPPAAQHASGQRSPDCPCSSKAIAARIGGALSLLPQSSSAHKTGRPAACGPFRQRSSRRPVGSKRLDLPRVV